MALVIQSRLFGEETSGFKKSLGLAEQAFECARDEHLPSHAVAETQIALAEALRNSDQRHDWRHAIKLLEDARNGGESRVARCACSLHLGELYLKLDDLPNAVHCLEEIDEDLATLEHGWLKERADHLRSQISKRKVFIINDDDLRQYHELTRDFVRFLVDRAKLKHPGVFNPSIAAAEIGVDRRTFLSWIEKLAAGKPI